jgi:phage terminase large subunit-like protein
MSKSLLTIKKEQLILLEEKKRLQQMLPHLYSFKWYSWAKAFFESRNKVNLVCAANQISKSSTQIRKCIHWATDVKNWEKLWSIPPKQFWYLYPSKDTVASEFNTKWIPEFMPRGEMKNDPIFGWKIIPDSQREPPDVIVFNSGVRVYFKTYSQNSQHLQSGTVSAIFCDEELPDHLFDELMLRLAATDGYFHMVFTATMGQEFWYRAMERKGRNDEALKDALKMQVSMFDCLQYADGTATPWTEKRIERIKNNCKSEAEIQKRVYGRFIKDTGKKFPCFERSRHMIPAKDVTRNHLYYSAVDIGSGGDTGHPAAILFVAVTTDYRKGFVFRGWRGDSRVTTSSDILHKYRFLRAGLRMEEQKYDWAGKDFSTYASRLGETFLKAEKGHEVGEDVVNVLFKNNMLFIHDIPELEGLAQELESLSNDEIKRFAKDDFADALRYCVVDIPWDWSVISSQLDIVEKKATRELTETEKRRAFIFGEDYEKEEQHRVESIISEYNELYDFGSV